MVSLASLEVSRSKVTVVRAAGLAASTALGKLIVIDVCSEIKHPVPPNVTVATLNESVVTVMVHAPPLSMLPPVAAVMLGLNRVEEGVIWMVSETVRLEPVVMVTASVVGVARATRVLGFAEVNATAAVTV